MCSIWNLLFPHWHDLVNVKAAKSEQFINQSDTLLSDDLSPALRQHKYWAFADILAALGFNPKQVLKPLLSVFPNALPSSTLVEIKS